MNHYLDNPEKAAKMLEEERKDQKAQVSIYNKVTGSQEDHFECTYDDAERKARNRISGHKELGYRITKVL